MTRDEKLKRLADHLDADEWREAGILAGRLRASETDPGVKRLLMSIVGLAAQLQTDQYESSMKVAPTEAGRRAVRQ